MIKRVTLLTRKAGMTREQFTRHWLDVHAPLAHAVPGLRRYVQSHIIEEYRRPDIPTTPVEVDGIAADMECLPPAHKDRTFYRPTDRGFEQEVRRRLAEWRKKP